MIVHVLQETRATLDDYALIPIAFVESRVMDVTPNTDGITFAMSERVLDAPFIKNYDASPVESPHAWPSRFDMAGWMFFSAYSGRTRVGGAVAIMDSTAVQLLDGREDLALLWDLRVAPIGRRAGVGSALVTAVEKWAMDRGARSLKVETQNVNVPACRFYEKHGFELKSVNPRAYAEFPTETQLLWYKELHI